MIPTINLIQDLKDGVNKNSNLKGQFIPLETQISALNKAQTKLILKKVGLSNTYQMGLDSFRKRYKDLEFFITPYEKLSVTKVNDVFNSYTSNLNDLTKKLLLPIDAYILATKGHCKKRILDIIEIVKHGDLQLKLKSPHSTPSFNYQESLATISENKFYTYADQKNSFVIDELYITYLRYPLDIDLPGYTHLDNTASVLQNCELEAYLENELIDLAIIELTSNIGDSEKLQSTLLKQKDNE